MAFGPADPPSHPRAGVEADNDAEGRQTGRCEILPGVRSAFQKGRIRPFAAPSWYPSTRTGNTVMLLACTIITAATQGYDGAMMGGMNILPQYTDYFQLSTAGKSLNVASNYVGGCVACCVWGWLSDAYGRRFGLFWAAALTIIAAVLQGAAQDLAMFCIARFLIGLGTTASVISGSAYLAETLPWDQRAWGLALFSDFYFVGALTAAGVTYASFRMRSTWAWRLPSLIQGIWGLSCIALLPMMPESPRWLMDQGQGREALEVLAHVNADGDTSHDLVRLQFRQIFDTLQYERNSMTWRQMVGHRGARKRLIISGTCAMFSMLTGNLLLTYDIGNMLAAAGVDNLHTQLLVNIGLSAISLVVCILGSFYAALRGSKSTALISTLGMAVSLIIVGLLTKAYGESDSRPGIRATVGMIYVSSAFYAFGYIPVLFLVPAEVLNFSIRAHGMSMFSFIVTATGIWGAFVFPLALDAIRWRLYLANAGWNILFFIFIAWYWVEVRGKTLEEIDALFDGRFHSDMPHVDEVMRGDGGEQWKQKVALWLHAKNWAGRCDDKA